jgi:hypothetical protein
MRYFNHAFLQVLAMGGLSYILDGGPQSQPSIKVTWTTKRLRINGIWITVNLPITTLVGGYGQLMTYNDPIGKYQEAVNGNSGLYWAGDEPCSMVDTLMTDNRRLNRLYPYYPYSQNSNSVISSLLSYVGLFGLVPAPPKVPGWGNNLVLP